MSVFCIYAYVSQACLVSVDTKKGMGSDPRKLEFMGSCE